MAEESGGHPDDAGAREIDEALHGVSEGHDHVRIEDLSGGTMGVNYHVGTHDTAIARNILSSRILVTNAGLIAEVLDHEDSADGHAGQVSGVQTLVDRDGNEVSPTMQYEGAVEVRQSLDKRGSATAARAGQPASVYGEGQTLVAAHEAIGDYTRGETDRVGAQAVLLEGITDATEVDRLLSGVFEESEAVRVKARLGLPVDVVTPNAMAA